MKPSQNYGNFSSFIYQLMPALADFINNDCIVYTKINYVRSNYQFYNDMESKQQLNEYLNEKILQQEFNAEKIKYLVHMCYFKEYCLKFYNFQNKSDETLFSFLYSKVLFLCNKCEKCHLPKYNHTNIYYYHNSYLLIAVEEKLLITASEAKDASQQKSQAQSAMPLEDPTKNDAENMQKLAQHMYQMMRVKEIQMFVECYECQEQLTASISLNTNIKKMSLGRFIQHMFLAFNNENPDAQLNLLSGHSRSPQGSSPRKAASDSFEARASVQARLSRPANYFPSANSQMSRFGQQHLQGQQELLLQEQAKLPSPVRFDMVVEEKESPSETGKQSAKPKQEPKSGDSNPTSQTKIDISPPADTLRLTHQAQSDRIKYTC